MFGDLSLRLDSDDTDFLRRLAHDPRVLRHVRDGTPWTKEHLQHRIADVLDWRCSTT